MQLEDLKAVVTGAARGMGRHFSLALAREGAQVAALDVDEAGLATLSPEADGLPGEIFTWKADVARENEVVTAIGAADDRFGGLNCLINNAGILSDGLLVKKLQPGSLLKFPLKQWQQVIDVDLTGTFLCSREVAAKMMEKGTKPGIIINISSVSRHGNAGQSNYSAAKAGVVAVTKVWARELAVDGIRVAAIAPGFIRTPILDRMPPGKLDAYVDRVPMKRLGEPEEIFSGIRFIVECDYFTGRCLEIDGGFEF
jgi:3-oxoacyl-[acyl-carrier protein] reductase